MKLSETTFEIGNIRPPNEGASASLLLRTTRHCPWNRCKFCYGFMYDHQKFQLRTVSEIKQDIDAVKTIADEIKEVSWNLGQAGGVTHEVISHMISRDPGLRFSECFFLVMNWVHAGAKTVFLQDANSLIMPTEQLKEILEYLGSSFPTITRITSYARSKTIVKKPLSDLESLRLAGLTRVHVGLETGDDDILKHMNKGVTAAEHILAGQKAKQAGFELSEYVMIDLGGRARYRQHAENTGKVLSEINPHYVRLRPLIIRKGTPLYDEFEKGDFQMSPPHSRLQELKILVENLHFTGRLCFDHFLNGWYTDASRTIPLFSQDHSGYQFPDQKATVLKRIEQGLSVDESVHLHYEEVMHMERL
jgi:radical SAM superfamily enzyme YgiQ (UPF0313 family)